MGKLSNFSASHKVSDEKIETEVVELPKPVFVQTQKQVGASKKVKHKSKNRPRVM